MTISHETGLTSGSVYPILHRLAEAGWLDSVEEPSETKGRPPHRCSRLTPLGLAEAAKVLPDVDATTEPCSAAPSRWDRLERWQEFE